MSTFDFIESVAPAAEPLQHSHSASQIEAELKGVFLDLFARLGEQTFDANVLGAAHLGSFELVRKMVTHDGLVFLPGNNAREEAATRYLYRAWKSGDVQKRGLHFLRTYLDLLAPGQFKVSQLWHDKTQPYPTALTGGADSRSWWLHQIGEPGLKLNGAWGVGRWITDPDELEHRKNRPDIFEKGYWLTSRVEISADIGTVSTSISNLLPIFRSIIPARLTPDIVMWLAALVLVSMRVEVDMQLTKHIDALYPWDATPITTDPLRMVQVGLDGRPVSLPAAMGTFRIGKLYGGFSPWQVGSRVVLTESVIEKDAVASFWVTESLPKTPPTILTPPPLKLAVVVRRLDGSWGVGGALRVGGFRLDGRAMTTRKMYATPKIGRFKILSHQRPIPPAHKATRLQVDGSWCISGPISPVITISTER